MLHEGFWMAEFVSISQEIIRAKTQYGRAYLHTEQEADLTYFFLFHLKMLRRAADALEHYLRQKATDARRTEAALAQLGDCLNHRQIAVLSRAAKDPLAVFTVTSHATSQRVSGPTAQADLDDLARRGFLTRARRGRRYEWRPGPQMAHLD